MPPIRELIPVSVYKTVEFIVCVVTGICNQTRRCHFSERCTTIPAMLACGSDDTCNGHTCNEFYSEGIDISVNTNRAQSRPTRTNSHKGHWERLRKRYDEVGLPGLADHEVVELMLTYVMRQGDLKPLAKQILTRFHDLPGVFSARREALCEVDGVGEQIARFLHLVRDVGQLALKSRAVNWGSTLACPKDVVEYLRALLANLPEEEFIAIFVDHANRIIRYETISQGVEDQTAVYPRKVMKRALALHATGIAVAHNHPTGNPQPSPADREVTRNLAAAAATLEIRLLDHIIIGRDQQSYFSFRENGLLP